MAHTTEHAQGCDQRWRWRGVEFLERHGVMSFIALFRLLFVITYPPNFGGDASNYYNMLTEGKSNLVHAPGYPFLVGLVWRNAWGLAFLREHPTAFSYALVLSQHVIALAALIVMERMLAPRLGQVTAAIAVLLYGLHWQVLGDTSSFYPEWLQASLLIASCAAALRACEVPHSGQKTLLYSVAAVLFVLSYLTKFNALFMLPLVSIPLVVDRLPRARKLFCSSVAVTLAFLTGVAFVVGYHQPRTGTYALTHDRAWVLLTKLQQFVPDGRLSPTTGVETKRLLLLNSLLPWDDNVGPISSIAAARAPGRKEYRRRYRYLLSADERVLDELLARTPLRSDFNFFTAFHPTAAYLGLAESDALGVRVYLENVHRYPGRFSWNVVSLTVRALVHSDARALFPLAIPESLRRPVGMGFVALRDQRPDYWNLPFYYRSPYVWLPGTKIFSALTGTYLLVPTGLVTFVVGLGICGVVIRWAREGRSSFRRALYLVLGAQILLYIVCSNAILGYRWKEAALALPFGCVLLSLCLTDAVTRAKRWLESG